MNHFFEQLKWKIIKFMQGRNGRDELANIVMYAFLAVYLVGVLFQSNIICLISYVFLAYYMYRVLSKDLYARREENRRFTTWMEIARIKKDQRKDYKIFKCKGCGRNIRVPRGKGKIEVTCPMCGNKTIHRT